MLNITLIIITVLIVVAIGLTLVLRRSKVQYHVSPLKYQPQNDPSKPKIKVGPYTNSAPGPIEPEMEVYEFDVDPAKEKAIAAMKSILQLSVKDYEGVVGRFIQQSEKIKSPKVVFKKLTTTAYDPTEYAKIISNDPVMVTRLLRTVNSASFGLREPISDVKRAIVYLGANTVKNLTMLISAEGMFASEDPDVNEAYQKFWLSAFVASMLTLKTAQQLNIENPSMLSTAALLSFMGNIAYINQYPEIAKQYVQCQNLFDRLKIETRLNEVHAAAIAGELTKYWNLPQPITNHLISSYDLSINPPHEYSDKYREAVVLYTCCRIGELVAFRDVEGLMNFSFSDYNDLDTYYIQGHLQAAKINNFYKLLSGKAIQFELDAIQKLLSK